MGNYFAPSTSLAHKPKARYEYLDGIRGMASLAVFNMHFTSNFNTINPKESPFFHLLFFNGSAAVHIFLVLVFNRGFNDI
jgi:peptidoglycan/LPS O-acetylase OafA/YrhL